MARFFQPTTTKGIYDSTANRLTVNVGDSVTIGLRCVSQKEEDEIEVSLSDMSRLGARYRIGPLVTEFEIDTSVPGTYTLEAERDATFSSSPKQTVVKPLTVHVRPWGFPNTAAIGQKRDPTGCWAACTAWYMTSLADRTSKSFEDMLLLFNGVWSRDGTINIEAFRRGVRNNNGLMRMAVETTTPKSLGNYLNMWPLVVGFRTPAGTAHMNVLYGYVGGKDRTVKAMEPWSPDTTGIDYADGFPYLTSATHTFTGAHVTRPLGYYESGLKGSGQILVGFPEEYRRRMP